MGNQDLDLLCSTSDFDPRYCDLCASIDSSSLLNLPTKHAMRSDRVIVPNALRKFKCMHCGLIRGGDRVSDQEHHDQYTDHYQVGVQSEHYFYSDQGPVARSVVLYKWIMAVLGEQRMRKIKRVLEVGCGSAKLLYEFSHRYPDKVFVGIEPHRESANAAIQQGLRIQAVTLSAADAEQYDLIYAVGVLEHVTSPTAFLSELRRRLTPGGLLVLCQPTQDVMSYDIFFIDHLHHFASEHVSEYAIKTGFHEVARDIGHPLMPNFSLHLWEAERSPPYYKWTKAPIASESEKAVKHIMHDINNLNRLLKDLKERQRQVAVFGLHDVYCLLASYSELGSYPFVSGLDDRPDKPEYRRLSFPVMAPEECVSLGVQDVLLAMNRIYYPQAIDRLERLGLIAHPIFGVYS